MPRPKRSRRICQEPKYVEFSPRGRKEEDTTVLSLDEFEVIRLVDYDKLTHEQCAKQMEISRTTVTEIYESARWKIADSLVNGCTLVIAGGNYRICDGSNGFCGRRRCRKRTNAQITCGSMKGEGVMRIAVTYEDGQIFQHFGHTEQFKLYDVEDGTIKQEQVVDTNGSGHGALADFLTVHKVDVLICGGIGGGAQAALGEVGIQLYGGVSGSADEAVKACIDETLTYNPNVHCNHHEHEHEDGEHHCGAHGCGNHGGH